MTIERISIEWRPVAGIPGTGHLYLIAREAGQTNELGSVISVGPSIPQSFPNVLNPLVDYGYIEINEGASAGGNIGDAVTRLTIDFYTIGETTELSRGSRDIQAELLAANPGSTLDQIWSRMVAYANAIDVQEIKYDPSDSLFPIGSGVNSNSVIVTLLSSVGVNFDNILPNQLGLEDTPVAAGLFPAQNTLVGTAGDDELNGYGGNDLFYVASGGSDIFNGGDGSLKSAVGVADGLDKIKFSAADEAAVTYTDFGGGETGWTYFQRIDSEVSAGKLYSIERFSGARLDLLNKIDMSSYNSGVQFKDQSATEIQSIQQNIDPDVTSSLRMQISPTDYAIVDNFGTFVGTSYDDTFTLNAALGRSFNGGDDGTAGDTLRLDGNFTAAGGKGIHVSAEGMAHEAGESVAVNIENFEAAPGKNGYFIIEEMGHNYLTDLVHVTDGPGYPLSRPVSYTTLSYKEYSESLTFNMYQSKITSASGLIDTFTDPVSIIGSDKGDTYVLRKYDKDYGFLDFDGAHYNTPIFSGIGNDIFTYQGNDNSATNQQVVYGGGDDRVIGGNYVQDLISIPFIFPVGVQVSDISYEIKNVRETGRVGEDLSGRDFVEYYADGFVTVGSLGTITYANQFKYVIYEDGEYQPENGFTNIGYVTTETELLEVLAFIDLPTQSVNIRTDFILSGGFYKEAVNLNFFNGAYHGTFGNDAINLSEYTLYTGYKAYDGDDSITGSIADNVIYGGAGNDSFLLAAGGGYDTIFDTEGNNTLRLAGINSDDAVYARIGDDLRIEIGGGVTIKDYFVESNTVSSVIFEGGASILLTNVTEGVITVPESAILDTNLGNILAGFAGKDSIFGFGGNDTLIGAAGDDLLYGGAGDDVYVFRAGDGYDTITDSEGVNILKIEGAISPFQLAYARIDSDLRIEIGSGVTIKDYYVTQNTVSYLQFDDGALFDLSLVAANAVTVPATALLGNNSGNILTGGFADDIIYGFGGNDTINGGAGDDRLYGGLGDDVYQVTPYEGFDEIRDEAGSDVVEITGSIHEIYYFYYDAYGFGAYFKDFASGFYAYGDGSSVSDMHVEKIRFSDGFEINFEDIRYTSVMSEFDTSYSGYFGREVVIGSSADNYISTAGGDDILYGGIGNDSLYGGADNDVLYGGEGDDFLHGQEGNNTLYGGLGSDEYTIILNSPVNYISDTGGDADIIRLGSGVAVFNFVRDADDLIISGFNNQIIIRGQYAADGQSAIEYIEYYGSVIDLDTIPVQEANTAPVAQDDVFTALEGQTVTGNVLAANGHGADSDTDNDPLTVVPAEIVTAGGGSVLLLSNGDFIYSPLENFNGADSFTYTLVDGQGGSDTGTVFLNMIPVNDGPEARDDAFSGDEDAVITGNVLADNGFGVDFDLDGDDLIVTAGTFATLAGGSVALAADGSFTYTPAANFNGPDSFTYTVNDGQGGSATGTAAITVNSVNDGPEARDDRFTGTENIEIEGNLLADNGFGADFDLEGDQLRVVQDMVTSAAGGSVILMHNGDFVYMPPANFYGEDSFQYTVEDGKGGQATATALITLEPGNLAPVALDDHESGFLLGTIGGNVLADNGQGADYDPDGDPLSVMPEGFMTANGGLVMLQANGDYTYTPVAGFTGTDSFTYTLIDGQGGSAVATVNLSVGLRGNEITGSERGDFILGTQQSDVILAKGGNDFVLGRQSADKILGGAGKDFIHGQNGDDLLIGGSGSDQLYGGNGHDILIGDDVLIIGSGAGTRYMQAGSGGEGDCLDGGNGNDLLIGGAGNDTLTGGNGADVFKFLSGANGKDKITDFDAREGDKIDISDVLEGGYDPLADMISQFAKIEKQGHTYTLSIDADGADNGAHFTAFAVIDSNRHLSLESMIQNGNLIV